MLTVPLRGWSEVLNKVDPDDIYDPDGDHGYSIYPHVTVIYGIHQVEDPIKMMLYIDKICRSVEIEFTDISVFDQNKDFDVLKFSVKGDALTEYHKKIKKKFDCTVDYPEYIPHLTIAYLKKNTGWKYKNIAFSMPSMLVDLMRFTNADGYETLIKLKNG